MYEKVQFWYAVVDQGFPRRWGTSPKGGGANLLFYPMVHINCMKMRKIIGLRGGTIVSANGMSHSLISLSYFGRGMTYTKVYEGSCIFLTCPQDNV